MSKKLFRTPGKNERDNDYMWEVLGNKEDGHSGDSAMSKLKMLQEHVHSAAKVYPTGGAGVTVTQAAGAWTLGAAATIIPANTVTKDFDVHYINIEGASGDDTYELVLYDDGVECGRMRFTTVDIANARFLGSIPMQTSLLEKNSALTAKVMGSVGSLNCVISVFYHEY